VGGTDLRTSKFGPPQNQGTQLWFLGHISAQNGSNFNFMAPLESYDIQVHESGIQILIPIAQLVVIAQFSTLNSFLLIFLKNSIWHRKFHRRNFKNPLDRFVEFLVYYITRVFMEFS